MFILLTPPPAPYLVNPGKGNADLGVKVFFIWGSTCVGCLVFTYFCIPEVCFQKLHYLFQLTLFQTKGLALEQIDLLYQNSTPITSTTYRKKLLEENITAAQVLAHEHKGAEAERHSEEKV